MNEEKQIKEMAKLCPFHEEGKCNLLEDKAEECNFDCDICDFAKTLYNAGYRKQSEGRYCADPKYRTLGSCSECGGDVTCLNNYCPNCGAKMKGGAE